MAVDERTIELINADIDGEISADERDELQSLLRDNPEAQAMQQELSALCSELDGMESLEPPTHLKHAIIDQVISSKTAAPAHGSSWTDVFAMPMFRHAAAFAAGVVMTAALINSNQISDTAFDDVSGLVGTIADVDLPVRQTIDLTSVELAGVVRIRQGERLTMLDFDLTASGTVNIVAAFPAQQVQFRGFAQLENENTSVTADAGTVNLEMNGKNRYALFLQHSEPEEAPLSLKFYASGMLIQEANVVITSAPPDAAQ